MGLFHMTSSDSPGFCHANRYIHNIQGLEVYMSASVVALQGGTDAGNTTDIGIGITPHSGNGGNPEYYDTSPAWAVGSVYGGFIDCPRYSPRRVFIGSYFDHPWTSADIAWDPDPIDHISKTLSVWLSVSMAGATVPDICDLTVRVVCDGNDHTETMTAVLDPLLHGLLMITGGIQFQTDSGVTSGFIVNTLNITEQP